RICQLLQSRQKRYCSKTFTASDGQIWDLPNQESVATITKNQRPSAFLVSSNGRTFLSSLSRFFVRPKRRKALRCATLPVRHQTDINPGPSFRLQALTNHITANLLFFARFLDPRKRR